MAFVQGSQNKKNLSFEINLLPIFDVLAVCICFLLMTVVWVEIRTLETKQAIGSQSKTDTSSISSVWLTIDESNNLTVTFKPSKGAETKSFLPTKRGEIDFTGAQAALALASSRQYQAAHILPAKTTKYNSVIRLMDLSKQVGLIDIGLSPI